MAFRPPPTLPVAAEAPGAGGAEEAPASAAGGRRGWPPVSALSAFSRIPARREGPAELSYFNRAAKLQYLKPTVYQRLKQREIEEDVLSRWPEARNSFLLIRWLTIAPLIALLTVAILCGVSSSVTWRKLLPILCVSEILMNVYKVLSFISSTQRMPTLSAKLLSALGDSLALMGLGDSSLPPPSRPTKCLTTKRNNSKKLSV